MPNYHCLLDTSALLKRYFAEDGTETIAALFARKDCARHIINITVAEVLAAFFRGRLKGMLNDHEAKELRDVFKRDRATTAVIIHPIHQGNISAIQKVYEASRGVPAPRFRDDEGRSREKPRIGPVDVLVLTACQEIKRSYGNDTFLFTSDEHMRNVATKLGLKVHNPEQIGDLPF